MGVPCTHVPSGPSPSSVAVVVAFEVVLVAGDNAHTHVKCVHVVMCRNRKTHLFYSTDFCA